MVRRLLTLACLVLAIGLVVAGCGDDDNGDGGGSPSGGGGIKAGTGSKKQQAEEAGKQAAKEAGGSVELPPGKTIGFLQILGGIESADRVANQTKIALGKVGYKMVLCDGQGDPTKWVTCGQSLLSRGVDAIMQTGIDPSSITPVVKQAKAKGVPIVQLAGLVGKGFDGSYYPDEAKAGQILSDYVIKELAALPDKPAEVAVHDYPAPWASIRTEQFTNAIKGNSDIKVVATTQTDPANLVNGTRKTVTDQITANPNLKLFWFAFDSAGQAGGQAVSAKFPGKSFPDKPMVATFHADLGTLELMRQGAIDVALDVPYDAAAWVGVDQLLQFWGRDEPFDPSPEPSYPGMGTIYDYVVVTKDNLPPDGEYREPKYDFVTFFNTKWAEEFGAN